MPRYIATFIPQMTNSWLGDGVYPADPKGESTWDCTDYLNTEYSYDEVQEIVEDDVGSELTDSVRDDPNAPEWIREWDGPFEVRVSEADEDYTQSGGVPA